jgi:WD40 repeat protein
VQAALAAAVLLTFAIGSVVSTLFAVQASRRAVEADVQRQAAVKAQHVAEQQGELARRNQYLALMNLAQQAWNSGNVAQCLEILQKLVPQPNETDLRGFEYYHLYRLCHQNVLTLKGHSAAVTSIAQSADGRVLLSGGADGKLLVWDVERGQLARTLAESLHPELRPDAGQLIGGIRAVAISRDGKLAASATFEEIQIWDVASGAQLHAIKKRGGDGFGFSFSPDGSLLAASVPLNVVRMWDTQSGEERKLIRVGLLDSAISAIAFSPDGETLAMATGMPVGAGTIRFVNVKSGRETSKRLTAHGAVILALAYSPDGRQLASGSADQRIHVWDLESRKAIASLQGHRGFITSLVLSPDGKQCISASADHTVRLWNLEKQELVSTLRGHTDIVTGLLLSPLDGKLITASGDSTVRMWARDLKSSQAIDFTTAPASTTEKASPLLAAIAGAAERPHLVTSVSIAPDHRRVAALVVGPSRKGTVELRTVSGAAEKRRFVDPEIVEQSFACAGLSPDGSLLAAGRGSYLSTFLTAALGMRPRPRGQEVLLWNVAGGDLVHRLAGHQFDVFCLSFSRTGNLLATADIGGAVQVWNVQTGKRVASFAGPDQTITDVRFSPDGRFVAAASAFKDSVYIWNVQTAEEIRLQTRFPTAVTFSPDGEQLAVGSGSFLAERSSAHGEVTVWDWRQKKPQFSIGGHTQFVMRVFYTHDGMRLWSIGFDGAARLWDLQTRYEIAKLEGDFNIGMSADVTEDGNQIAVGTENGKVILWDATPQP